MYTGNPVPPPQHVGSSTTRKVGILLRELLDDEDGPDTHTQDTSADPNDAWREDFKGYLHSRDQLLTMSIVEWWGVRIYIWY